jgi:SAM-dependent methyltransferase
MRDLERRFRILEIGSGNAPSPSADVLVDKHPDTSAERTRQEPLTRDARPLIVADGVALPFASQSFDQVLAIGVLEHSDDPVAFLEEMARVGRRGMIRVPTTFAERIYYRPFHRFTFLLDGQTLVIRRKNFPDVFGGLFDYLAHYDPDFTRFMAENRWLFSLEYAWEGQPRYRLEEYDPCLPSFSPFARSFGGPPFEFRLCTSELSEGQVAQLMRKQPPSRWQRALARLRRPLGTSDIARRGR